MIVLASDGMLDNVYAEEVAEIVAGYYPFSACTADELATALAARASTHAVDREFLSPFARAANEAAQANRSWWQKESDPVYMGGKLDDITVVVAFLE